MSDNKIINKMIKNLSTGSSTNRRDGVVVGASASHSVDLGFSP